MSRIARRILFFFFVTFFLVTAPLLVLYTAGFRYNFTSGSIVRTGVISITTNPRNAEIFLNEESIERSTPYVIKQLIPGTYQVMLKRPEYHPWNGEVEVTSGTTTIIENIPLLRKEQPNTLFTRSLEQLAPSPNGNILAYLMTNKTTRELWLYHVDTQEERLVAEFSSASSRESNLSWSTTGQHLLLDSGGALFVYTNTGEEVELPITEVRSDAERFWHPSDDRILYIASTTQLTQVNVTNGETDIFEGDNIDTVLIDASLLRFVDNGSMIELRQIIDDESRLVALLPRANYEVVKRDGPYLVLTDHRSHLVLVNIRSDQPLLLETRANMFDWLPDQSLLLYSDGHEVNVYDPKTHHTEFITRQGTEITGVEWHPSGNLIFLSTQDELRAIETFRTAKERQITPLLTQTPIHTFWLSEDGKMIYYYSENNLNRLRIAR